MQQHRRRLRGHVEVVGDDVLGLREAERTEMPVHIRRVIGHEHDGRRVEAVHQNADLFIDAQAEGAEHPAHALGLKPVRRGIQQRTENRGIVLAVDIAEMAEIGAMALLRERVDLGADAADGAAAAIGQPIFAAAMLIVGILVLAQRVQPLQLQRRDIAAVAAIDLARNADELAERRAPRTGSTRMARIRCGVRGRSRGKGRHEPAAATPSSAAISSPTARSRPKGRGLPSRRTPPESSCTQG